MCAYYVKFENIMHHLPFVILLEEMSFDGGSSKTKGGSTC